MTQNKVDRVWTETEAHSAIGAAVLACQSLELLFALCVRFVFKQAAATSLAEITPLEKNFSKPPMTSLLRELRRHVNVSTEFETTLLDLIGRRHILIHRWAIEHYFPVDEQGYAKIGMFAEQLAEDAGELSAVLHRYLVEWTSRFPQLAGEFDASGALSLLPVSPRMSKLTIEKARDKTAG